MLPPRHLSPHHRAVCGALAALLLPVLLAGCGSAGGHSVRAAGDAATPSASASASAASPSASVSPSATATPGAGSSAARGAAGATSGPASPSGRPATPNAPAATKPAAPRPDTPAAPRPTGGRPVTSTPPAPAPPAVALVRSTATGGRSVALTFDDGPGPATGPILDLLAQYHVRATFCMVGTNAAANPALVRRIVAEGHRLCDHTVHHPQPLHALSHDRQVQEITAAKDMILDAAGAGTPVTWFRAPGGDFTAENEQIAARAGMRSLSWSVDPRDWSRPGTAAIVSAVQRGLRPGGVVLMHDGGGDRSQTVAALRLLLPWLTAQGYCFDLPAS
ncbi:polysaccharide deacetylase family protein [Kitasatospora sp. NPDC088346]|uniref:polysaccharide deacetylase family protein n=1 Tax=Kitasatospora sp. NPDC088346 TaxID=3364073 RepID=UPI00381906FC